MVRYCALFLSLFLCAHTASAQVYKWVDEDGIVHYSDQPAPGAERIDIQQNPRSAPAPRRSTATRAAAAASDTAAAEPAKPFSYESLSFTSPGSEQTLWNIGGTLNVTMSLSPALRNGDRVRLYFDGAAQPISGTTSVQLEEVWRGAHNLQAEVLDANGTLMIRSEPIRFYVQQTSVAN
jgi:hypothetical protein